MLGVKITIGNNKNVTVYGLSKTDIKNLKDGHLGITFDKYTDADECLFIYEETQEQLKEIFSIIKQAPEKVYDILLGDNENAQS